MARGVPRPSPGDLDGLNVTTIEGICCTLALAVSLARVLAVAIALALVLVLALAPALVLALHL